MKTPSRNSFSPFIVAYCVLLTAAFVTGRCDFQVVDFRASAAADACELRKGVPILLRNAFDSPMADKEEFLSRFGQHEIVISHDMEQQSRSGLKTDHEVMNVSQWVSTWGQPGAARYAFTFRADIRSRALSSSLFSHHKIPKATECASWRPFFVIGGESTGIRLHMHGATWVALLHGRKRWYVKAANQAHDQEDWEIHGATFHEEALKNDPRYESCDQEASEILLLPEWWWHATFDLDPWTVGIGAQVGPGEDRISPLDYAAVTGNLTAFKRKNLPGKRKLAPARLNELLISAAISGQEQLCQELIDNGADPALQVLFHGRNQLEFGGGPTPDLLRWIEDPYWLPNYSQVKMFVRGMILNHETNVQNSRRGKLSSQPVPKQAPPEAQPVPKQAPPKPPPVTKQVPPKLPPVTKQVPPDAQAMLGEDACNNCKIVEELKGRVLTLESQMVKLIAMLPVSPGDKPPCGWLEDTWGWLLGLAL